MQMKRDKLFTTLGWSVIGNIFGLFAVGYVEKNSDKYRALKQFKKREMLKIFSFFGTIGLFTFYGYGTAQ